MNETEKFRVLIPHWIEHNQEHAEEYRRWAVHANEASQDILAATESLMLVNQVLAEALKKLAGPMPVQHIHDIVVYGLMESKDNHLR
ncbi:MAG: hypothetical protein WAV05_14165 [Anaerolineales bacterium]